MAINHTGNRNGSEDLRAVSAIIDECGFPLYGFVSFSSLAPHLRECAAACRLPVGASTVIIAAFPYFSGNPAGGNLSKYAMPEDYHLLVGARLGVAAKRLSARFPGCRFEGFTDNSPIPEVSTACRAGLGVRGSNGLLLTQPYGSFVFLGELVTDLSLPAESVPGWEAASCERCGACIAACPGGALPDTPLPEGAGPALNRTRCVSAVTQKKGALSDKEAALLRAGGSVWGCDRCQDVCPHNRRLPFSPLPEFRNNLLPRLTAAALSDPEFEEKNERRAFLWRGKSVLQRNLALVEESGCTKEPV